jgi:hypothetical protein
MPPSAPSPDPEKPAEIQDESKDDVGIATQHTFTHHDPNWAGDDVDFSNVDEKNVLRKMDLRLLPMLALLYLLSFLDRGNIGNAKIEGLADDLHMTGPQYNWCLTVFFFTYCAFEVPSNLMFVLSPSYFLDFQVLIGVKGSRNYVPQSGSLP